VAVFVAVTICTAHPQNFESALGGTLVIVAGCLPCAIWTLKQLGGLPVFPVFALTHIWAFGVPLLYEHPIVIRFLPEEQFLAAISVTGFLLLATLVWHQTRRKPAKSIRQCLSLESRMAETVFLVVLGAGIVFALAANGGWLTFVPGEVFSIIRAVMMALEALSCFVLSHRLGARELGGGQGWLFKALLFCLVVATLPTLYMITGISLVAIAVLGYVSASGKVPWMLIIGFALVLTFLHAGKSDIRQQYWEEEAEGTIQPWDYPVLFGKWATASVEGLWGNIPDEDERGQSMLERSSLLQLLIFEQDCASRGLPFMYGETYVIVPELLIPRIFFPGKPEAHAGTHRLNVYYGFQTEEESEHTTLGFGLLNESFANFGYVGMAMLALALGAFYGYVERVALAVPLLSLRGLFVVVVACFSFQVEYAAGVWASALFQSLVALLGLAFLLMKVRPIGGSAPESPAVPRAMRPVRPQLEHA
jgi:hypothetical protein